MPRDRERVTDHDGEGFSSRRDSAPFEVFTMWFIELWMLTMVAVPLKAAWDAVADRLEADVEAPAGRSSR